jgi:hypothetical protein
MIDRSDIPFGGDTCVLRPARQGAENLRAVSWLQYFARDLTNRQMAIVLAVSAQLVGRYVQTAAKQMAFHKPPTTHLRPGSLGS